MLRKKKSQPPKIPVKKEFWQKQVKLKKNCQQSQSQSLRTKIRLYTIHSLLKKNKLTLSEQTGEKKKGGKGGEREKKKKEKKERN